MLRPPNSHTATVPVNKVPVQNAPLGMLLLAFASVSFATMGAIAHTVKIPFWELALFRGVIMAFLLLPVAYFFDIPLIGKGQKWMLFRSVAGSISLLGYFFALQTISLADAAILTFSSPLWIACLAPFLLQEKVYKSRIFAVTIGMIGLIFVLGPSGRWLEPGGIAGLSSGLFSGIAYICVRKLRSDHPLTVILHFSVVSALLALPGTLMVGRVPVGIEWLEIISVGFFATVGQYLMTMGFQRVEASAGSIVALLNPVLSQILSALFFCRTVRIFSNAGKFFGIYRCYLSFSG